jgi:5-aminolevulinate synthase
VNYDHALDAAIDRLHDEGRYRTFIDIERKKGQFPHAVWNKPDGTKQDITVWCGNDYLGMGQHPVVLEAMHEALEATGAGSGGTRNISGTTVYHKRAGGRACRSAWQGGGAGLHLRLHRQ